MYVVLVIHATKPLNIELNIVASGNIIDKAADVCKSTIVEVYLSINILSPQSITSIAAMNLHFIRNIYYFLECV